MIPTAMARTPRTIMDVLSDLNMTAFLSLASLLWAPAVLAAPGSSVPPSAHRLSRLGTGDAPQRRYGLAGPHGIHESPSPCPLRTPGRCRRPLAQLCAGREPCANPAVMSPRGGRTPCWPSCWCRRSRQLTHGRQSGPERLGNSWIRSGRLPGQDAQGRAAQGKDQAVSKTKDVRAAVEKELGFDPRVDSSDIKVMTIGGNVNLTGTVPSFPQYLQASAAARR